ncbi:Anaphase-promoting complex subunit 7 [Podila epigama]|nr:Anaphase-promoting complex subunit 7 [Podila epigama]
MAPWLFHSGEAQFPPRVKQSFSWTQSGMHLSSACSETLGDAKFRADTLLQLANSLSKLEEKKRAEAQHLKRELGVDDADDTPNTRTNNAPNTISKETFSIKKINNTSKPIGTAETGKSLLMETLDTFDPLHIVTERRKRARMSREALQNSAMRIADKVREAKASIEPSIHLTRPVQSEIPHVKLQSKTIAKPISSGAPIFVRRQRLIDYDFSNLNAKRAAERSANDEIIRAVEEFISKSDYKRALDLLSKIPEHERNVRVYLLYIQLNRKQVELQPILTEKACWEYIIELQPFALEAHVHLIRLQTTLSFLLNTIPSVHSDKLWMTVYLQGVDHMFHTQYKAALSNFSTLDARYPQSVDIKLKMAVCYRWLGMRSDSCRMFSQVRAIDPYVADDMYHYGSILIELERLDDVNKLAQNLLSVNDAHPDSWCVLALFLEAKGHLNKALLMANRALLLMPSHCGALHIRAPLKALQCFRDACTLEKDIVAYSGLVQAYILLDRFTQALTTAEEALRMMPENAQAMATYGTALLHAKRHQSEVQEAYLEALRKDPGCLEASDGLCSIYEQQQQYEKILELLDQQVDYNRPDEAHVKKARIYFNMSDWRQALLSYQEALFANPENQVALKGRDMVERMLSGVEEEEEEEVEEQEEERGINYYDVD